MSHMFDVAIRQSTLPTLTHISDEPTGITSHPYQPVPSDMLGLGEVDDARKMLPPSMQYLADNCYTVADVRSRVNEQFMGDESWPLSASIKAQLEQFMEDSTEFETAMPYGHAA